MTLGLKIQNLRKKSQMTQDELAEALGVSRQALSKWENDQSSPDIDKIVLMSETFSVTTDYLLKDQLPQQSNLHVDKKNQSTFKVLPVTLLISSTIIVLIGLIIAIAMQYSDYYGVWSFRDAALGIIIQLMGIGLYTFFHINQKYDKSYQLWFWIINIWFVSYIHHNLIFNFYSSLSYLLFPNARYTNAYWISDLAYLVINGGISLILFRSIQRHKRELKDIGQ
ncbi:MAG: helix-turn-helix transcriptional regulator [Erysipelothrix sp.]|jgi:DNA-binding XRE family transcriptional regulator|nr:helix-turn-helix transcriptional regulator [Erysipelothrix sp.]